MHWGWRAAGRGISTVAAGNIAVVAALAPAGLAEVSLSLAAGAIAYAGVLTLLIPDWSLPTIRLLMRRDTRS